MGIGTGFIFQFGTGIGALMRPVTELLKNQNITINKEEVALLIITSLAIILSDSKENINKLVSEVRDRGLYEHIKIVSKFLLSVKDLMSVIGDKVGKTVHTLSDILGFTFMLVPTMNILSTLINQYNVTSDNIGELIGGLVLAGGSYGVKSIVDKIMKKGG